MDAWDRAEDAARSAGVELRPLTTIEDADRILDVMIATWGNHQLLPREMIRALGHSGNAPCGAFDGDELIGYVLGWAGIEPDDGLHVHSHMLATLPDRRHRGVGLALKMAQRAQCLEQGITLVRWTFDPLLSRNAHFNLTKLGAVADRFLPNFYGEMTDTLNAGERSDRLMVRWDLEREPSGPSGGFGVEVLGRGGDDPSLPSPVPSHVPASLDDVGDGAALIRIPREYHDLRERDRSLAQAWREATSEAFTACFDAGLVANGFTGDSTYVFTRER
jgi:predicted GNAT superfamily acetyltransferase